MNRSKNNFVSAALSFEDFEQILAVREPGLISADEIVKEKLTLEQESKKKEAALKKAHHRLKRSSK